MQLKCKHCNRLMGEAYGTIVAELKCPNSSCRATTQFKIINADQTNDIRYKFLTKEILPKKMRGENENN